MNATAQQTEPNTHEMVVIHRIFRREFPLLAGIVPRASNGDTRRAAYIARHIEFCLDGLHIHHTAEDEDLWPVLQERARPHAELVRRMKVQHEAVAQHSEQPGRSPTSTSIWSPATPACSARTERGKTTFRWLFATALAPTQGRVSVLGLDPAVPAQRTDIRRRLGYLPQEIGFPRGFSGFAFVDYAHRHRA